jgi:hypothetical protein
MYRHLHLFGDDNDKPRTRTKPCCEGCRIYRKFFINNLYGDTSRQRSKETRGGTGGGPYFTPKAHPGNGLPTWSRMERSYQRRLLRKLSSRSLFAL